MDPEQIRPSLHSLYYKLPTTGNSFQIIYDAYRILFNHIGLCVSSSVCVLGALWLSIFLVPAEGRAVVSVANEKCKTRPIQSQSNPNVGLWPGNSHCWLSARLCLKTPSSARERAVFRLAKTAKQAMLVLSSMEPDAVRRKISRSKPDRVLRQSLIDVA